MKLTHVCIDHFRNLCNVALPVEGLRVLVGPNGAGKTSLLEGIRRLSDSFVADPDIQRSRDSFFKGYRIYEVDECLGEEGLFVDASHPSQTEPGSLLRSTDAFNLAAALLGRSETLNALSLSEYPPWPIQSLVLDSAKLHGALKRGAAIFLCSSESVLIDYLKEDRSERLDPLRDAFKSLARDEVEMAAESASILGLMEMPLVVPVRERHNFDGLYFKVAEGVFGLAKQSRRFAWAPTFDRDLPWEDQTRTKTGRTWGYAGVIVDREDVPDDLAAGLTELGKQFDPEDLDDGFFFGDVSRGFGPQAEDIVTKLPTRFSAMEPGNHSPLTEVIRQWMREEPFLRVTFSGDTGPLWRKHHGDISGTVKAADRDRRMGQPVEDPVFDLAPRAPVSLKNRWKWQSRDRRLPGNPVGLPELDVVIADGDVESLQSELEKLFPALHDRIWGSLNLALIASNKAAARNLPAIFGQPPRAGRLHLLLGREAPWLVNRDTPFHRHHDPVFSAQAATRDEIGASYSVRPSIPPVLDLLTHWANLLAPTFLGFAGGITIGLKPLTEWSEENRLIIQFEDQFGAHASDELPSGWARWVGISVLMASRHLLESDLWLLPNHDVECPEGWDDEAWGIVNGAAEVMEEPTSAHKCFEVEPSGSSQTILVIDEPEAHLHPDAVTSVKEWLSQNLAETGISAVIATHAPAFMDYTLDEATIFGIWPPGSSLDGNQESRCSSLEEASSDFVKWVEEHGTALGVESLGGLFIKRGFLCVEGIHDQDVLERFYKKELDENRIGLVVNWGIPDKLGHRRLADSRFLRYAHKPVALLLDNAVLDRVRDSSLGVNDLEYEEQQLRWLEKSFISPSIPYGGFSHGLIDIAFALPEEAVRRFLASENVQGTFEDGWGPIEAEVRNRGLKGKEIKKEVQRLLGLPVTRRGYSRSNFIEPILALSNQDRPDQALEDEMTKIFQWFQNPRESSSTL